MWLYKNIRSTFDVMSLCCVVQIQEYFMSSKFCFLDQFQACASCHVAEGVFFCLVQIQECVSCHSFWGRNLGECVPCHLRRIVWSKVGRVFHVI